VCRVAIKMPIMSMNQVMVAVPELRINIPSNASRRFHRKLATLKLRLSMKIRQLGITSVLHVRNACPETESFLAAFRSAATFVGEDEEDLEACMRLCKFSSRRTFGADPNAAILLLDIPKSERFMEKYRQLSDIQLVSDVLLTTSL
jgi:hypothetical protein